MAWADLIGFALGSLVKGRPLSLAGGTKAGPLPGSVCLRHFDRELGRYAARNHNLPNDLGGFEIETHATPQRRRNIYKGVK